MVGGKFREQFQPEKMKNQTRGWVYVIANEHIQDKIKVGFSLKDPVLRAKELSNTGTPGNYSVLYAALTVAPAQVEQAVHRELKNYWVDKEWFRIDARFASEVIKRCSKVEFEICSWIEINEVSITKQPVYESEFMKDINRRKKNLENRNAQNLAIVKLKEKRNTKLAEQISKQQEKSGLSLSQTPSQIRRSNKSSIVLDALRSRLEREIAFLDQLTQEKKQIDQLHFPYFIKSGVEKDKDMVLRRIKITENIIQQLKSEIEN